MMKIDASGELDPALLVKRRSQWSVVFAVVVSLAGLLAVLFLGGSDQVSDARVVWDGHGHTSYDYEVWLGGRTADPPRVRLSVRGGDVTDAVWVSTTHRDSLVPGLDQDLATMTIDDLFELIEKAVAVGNGNLEFDATVGYPARGRLDPDAQGFDDEWEFGVVDFVVVDGSRPLG
jgi:hypothetical protein